MFPLLFPLLLGAGGGALLNKKDPLKGALMGAALGTGVGSIGGLLGASGAAGAAGAAAAPAAATGAALPGAAGAASALPAAGQAAATAVPQAEGFGGLLSSAEKYMKPVGTALGAVNAAQGLLGQQQPMQAPQMQQRPGPDMSAWMSAEQQERANMGQIEAQRRLVQKQAIQGLLGGGYGGLA